MYHKLFSLQENVFKTIANEKRLEIIQLLAHSELTVTEMVDMLGIRQANLSQHLMLLRDAKLVTTRRDGLKIYYLLADSRINEACMSIREFLKHSYNSDPEISSLLARDKSQLYPVVKDIVCNMRISVSEAMSSITYENREYYFCGQGCEKKFTDNQLEYVIMENSNG